VAPSIEKSLNLGYQQLWFLFRWGGAGAVHQFWFI